MVFAQKIGEIDRIAESAGKNIPPASWSVATNNFGETGEKSKTMLFMVIERFEKNDMVPTYERFLQGGRSLPDGLEFVESWVEASFGRCFQLMRCSDPKLFQEWILHWRGCGVTMEIVPVVPSAETRALVTTHIQKAASAG